MAREQEKNKKGSKSKQKTMLESTELTMGSLKRRKCETWNLAWSKLCKEMGEKLSRTPSLEEASPIATIAQCKIVVASTF
jgi:hypothetical protein